MQHTSAFIIRKNCYIIFTDTTGKRQRKSSKKVTENEEEQEGKSYQMLNVKGITLSKL